MQLTTRQRIALSNAGKYRNLSNANNASMNQKYWVSVLMGEPGIYLVPATPREASILVALGYEEIPRSVLAQVA